MKGATGGDDDLHLMMRTAMARTTLIDGELWVAITNEGKVVGTAAWYPPSAGKPDRYLKLNHSLISRCLLYRPS